MSLVPKRLESVLTKENGVILGTCAAGLGAFALAMEAANFVAQVSLSESQYRSKYARNVYGTTGGAILTSGLALLATDMIQKEAIDMGYMKKGALRRARTASVSFTGALLASRLDLGQIGKRVEYLSQGSMAAAVQPTMEDAMLLDNARSSNEPDFLNNLVAKASTIQMPNAPNVNI